jgi:N utilization substance protein B
MARRRHQSRVAVMQALFERDSRPSVDPHASLLMNEQELGESDGDFAAKLMLGILEHEGTIKQSIQDHAPGWTLDRMDPISRCILLMGAYELLFANDAPPAVVMNEAIDIAKEYGSDEAGKFVNGVLNAIAQGKKIS